MILKLLLLVVSALLVMNLRSLKNPLKKAENPSRPFQRLQFNAEIYVKKMTDKYNEAKHLVSAFKEYKVSYDAIEKQFRTLLETPMSKTYELEFQPLTKEMVSILETEQRFYKQMPFYTVEAFQELWGKSRQASHSQLSSDTFTQKIKENEDIKTFMNVNVKNLEAQWKELNLYQRVQEYGHKLADLAAQLSDETITRDEVMLILQRKMKTVAYLIVQCDVVSNLLKKVTVGLSSVPESSDTIAITSKLEGIRKDLIANPVDLDSSHKTLKEAIKIWVKTGTGETYTTPHLSTYKGIKEAYAVQVEKLFSQWLRFNFIQRAEECLNEVNAVKSRGSRTLNQTDKL